MSYSAKYTDIKLVGVQKSTGEVHVHFRESSIEKGCKSVVSFPSMESTPKYVKYFCSKVKAKETEKGTNYFWGDKVRKEYTYKKAPRRHEMDIKDNLYAPNGHKFVPLERDIISVCHYRMNNIKDACKNCCYKDSNRYNIQQSGGLKKTGRQLKDYVCYGCQDFLKLYNSYPNTMLGDD